MARMTTTTNSNLLRTEFFARRFVESARANSLGIGLAMREDAPRSNGKTAVWQYLANPAAATNALQEGNDPPTPRDLSTTTASATMEEYGDYFEPSRTLISTAASGTLAEIVDAAGWQAAITIDTLIQTQSMQATTNTNDLTDGVAITAESIRTGIRGLASNNERRHPATTGGRYYPIWTNDINAFDLMGEGRAWGKTTATTPTWETIHGTDMGVRGSGTGEMFMGPGNLLYGGQFFISNNLQQEGGDDNTYILGANSFGAVSIDSDVVNPRVIITMPDERVDLALRGHGSVGWWINFATTLIRSNATHEIVSN